jgi:MFS family permease
LDITLSGLRKDLRAIAAEGAAANAMAGAAENYLPAFVLAISGSALACGLASTVPMVIGALGQLAAPYLIGRLGSYRRWVVLCAVLQAAVFLPIIGASLAGSISVVAAFAVISIYWGTGMAGGPAWNNWVATLIPARIRANYMARRTRLAQLGTLSGFVLGGLALQAGSRTGYLLPAFALVFLGAMTSRLCSARFLAMQQERAEPQAAALRCGLGELWNCLTAQGAGKIVIYLVAVQAAVQISGPYFTPYMLKRLEFSYSQYVILVGVAYIARVLCLPWLGSIAERFGPQRLLWIGGAGIIPCSSLWLISDRFDVLLLVQVFTGVAWAAYELATALLFFSAIPAARRIPILTTYNLAYATATLVGSLVGGYVLSLLLQTREAFLVLFVISSMGRLAALGLLAHLLAPAFGRTAIGAGATLAALSRWVGGRRFGKFAGWGVLTKLGNHLPGRRFDRLLPPLGAELGVLAIAVGEKDAAGVVDHRPAPLSVERGGDVPGRAPLAAVAGDEQPSVRHPLAERGQLCGVSRPDDRAHRPVTAIAGRLSGEFLHVIADPLEERAAAGQEVLDHAPAGVGGLHEDEHARVPLDRNVYERLQAVSP